MTYIDNTQNDTETNLDESSNAKYFFIVMVIITMFVIFLTILLLLSQDNDPSLCMYTGEHTKDIHYCVDKLYVTGFDSQEELEYCKKCMGSEFPEWYKNYGGEEDNYNEDNGGNAVVIDTRP